MMPAHERPILLYNDECAVCRVIGTWVRASSGSPPLLDVRPIGDDPAVLARLHPGLDIWDAYETVHLLMPDGSMKTGGAAVLDVLRALPGTHALAVVLELHAGGFRPGALLVNAAYALLADVRPLLGCESCGSTNALVRSVRRAAAWIARGGRADRGAVNSHFASVAGRVSRPHPRPAR